MEKQQRSFIRNSNFSKGNINENVNGTEKSSKRVSFSSRNRVKTFVKGSETTQWDVTYEEAIHSTQSSQEITNKTPEKNTPQCENNSINSTELNQTDEEQSTDTEEHANQTLFNIESLSMEIEETDRIIEIHTHKPIIVIDKENLPIMIDKGNDEEQTICQSINNMEFTCQNTMKNPDISDMELTCQMQKLPNNSTVKSVPTKTDKVTTCQQTESDTLPDMEFTCQLPNSIIQSVLNKTEMELICQQLGKIKESKIESSQTDIEFTCRSPNSAANSSLKSVPNKSEMELTCQQNTNDKSTDRTTNRRQTIFSIRTDTICNNLSNSMDDISLQCNKTDIQKKIDGSNIKTGDLSSVSEDVSQHSDVDKKQQPLNYQHGKDDNFELEDMKFTCRLPPISTSALKSKELPIFVDSIKQQPSNDLLGVTKTNNKIDMELTCQLEITNKFIGENFNETMKMTCHLSNSVKIKTNVEEQIVSADISGKSIEAEKNHDILVKEDGINLTELKLSGDRSEILEQEQNCLNNDDDIEDMEWSATTPQKSTENRVQINQIRKRSLLSSFIPFDSPQIIKKPALSNGENQPPKSSMNLSTKFITADGIKKSNILTPISSEKSKKQKITQPHEEHLDFLPIVSTTTTKSSENDNKEILYSDKIDKNFEKYNLTCIKTPDRSGMKIMSPRVDYTQQLIDASVTIPLPEPSISINKTTSINKLQEIEITLPNTSCTQLNIDDNYDINDTTASLKENRRFQNINNTFVLNKLSNHNDNECKDKGDVYIDDCSIELVSSFDDTNTTIDKSDSSDDYDFPLTRKFLENFKLKRFRFELEPFPSTSNIEKKQKFIDDFIDNFEFQQFTAPSVEDVDRLMERLRTELDHKSQNNSIIEISDSVNNESILEERIRTLGKEREEGIWELIETNNNLYKFNIVYSRLVLTVELNPDYENVANFTIDIAKPEKITNLLNYIHKAIKQELNLSNLQSKLGQSYDLVAFLQYTEMVIEKLISFIKDFTLYEFYDPIFDEDCWLSFKIRDADKMKFFIIFVNMLNLGNLTDDNIKIAFKFGDCDVKKLKKIVKKCSKVTKFLHNLIKSIEEYCI